MITFDCVTKSYKNNTVFSNLCLSLYPNNIYGIIGDNGSGKTVFLKMLCGLTLCDSGMIKYQGKTLGKDIEHIPGTSALIESPGFLPFLSGSANLRLLASLDSVSTQRVKDIMLEMGLDYRERKKVASYSLGMRQKLSLAQAFMGNSRLLLLDEPTNSLDKDAIIRTKQIIKNMRSPDRIIVVVSHLDGYIDDICDIKYQIIEKNLKIQ